MYDRLALARCCRALWGEVLLLALLDARKGRDVNWLRSPDFATVSALAGIDPDAAQTLADRVHAEIRAAQAGPGGPRQLGLDL